VSVYHSSDETVDLRAAIEAHITALSLRPPYNHSRLTAVLANLGTLFYSLYGKTDDKSDLDASINYATQDVDLFPRGHPEREQSLGILSLACFTRYQLTREVTDLDTCVDRLQEVLSSNSQDSSTQTNMLTLLNMAQEERSKHLQRIALKPPVSPSGTIESEPLKDISPDKVAKPPSGANTRTADDPTKPVATQQELKMPNLSSKNPVSDTLDNTYLRMRSLRLSTII
jgi:hypothetical protein